MNLNFERPIVFLDVETTGTSPTGDRIVDITLLKVFPDGREEEIMSMKINPEISIPREATEIHGITNEDVRECPNFRFYAQKILHFLNDCDIGGFNVKRFDLAILEAEFSRADIVDFSRQGRCIIDAQIIYHELEPRDLSAAYKRYCKKELKNAHTSSIDARASFEILKSQIENEDIPCDINELHKFCHKEEENWIDNNGKIIQKNGEAIMNFGKHKGTSLRELCEKTPDYIEWILNADFSLEVKEIIRNAMDNKFSEPS